MEIEPPYNNSDIIYEITDNDVFLSDLKKDLDRYLINIQSMKPLRLYNKEKYTDDFLKNMNIKSNILTTAFLYITKNEEGNFLITNNIYCVVVKEHLKYIYYKFLNIMVDDGYLNMYFDSKKEEFMWKPIKKKRK